MNSLERRSTFALGSIFALRMLGLFMIIPVFSIYGKQYIGATPQMLGVAIGIYGLTQAIMQMPFSMWADRYSRKPLIVVGLALFAVGAVISALSISIQGVIIGRAVAGSGAVSAVVMALLADVTREEYRSKAMAVMGMTIALSFIVAFSIGPLLMPVLHLSGQFWLTAALAVVAMFMLFLVPTPTRAIRQYQDGYWSQFKRVIEVADLNRLHLSSFFLHLLVATVFFLVPTQLIQVSHIKVAHHGWVYLPLLLLGFVLAVPAIVVAEAKRKMRQVLLVAVLIILLSLLGMAYMGFTTAGLLVGLALFFIGFNTVEALLPSWLSKKALVGDRATAMGINGSAQFLGASLGGFTGGQLLAHGNMQQAWLWLAALAVVWLLVLCFIHQPPYLSSIAVRVPVSNVKNAQVLAGQMLHIQGVADVVVMAENQVAYLKIDKTLFTEIQRQELSQLLSYDVVF